MGRRVLLVQVTHPKYQVDFCMVNLISYSDKIKAKIAVAILFQYSVPLLTLKNPNVHFRVSKLLAFMVILSFKKMKNVYSEELETTGNLEVND